MNTWEACKHNINQDWANTWGTYRVNAEEVKVELNRMYGAPKIHQVLNPHSIKNVIFNPPATIVFWADNTKTVVKCGEHDEYDPEKGLAMAFAKKALGNHGNYYNVFRKWLPKEDEKSSMFDLNKSEIFSFTFNPANIRIHDALGRIFDLGAPTDIKMEGESDE